MISCKLKDVCKLVKGKQIDTTQLAENLPFKYINGGVKESGYYEKYNTNGNTIIISEGGASCGYVSYITEKFWLGCHCYKLIDVSVDSKYLFYALKANQQRIMELRTGAAMPNIKKTILNELQIKISMDEAEQKQAVKNLDYIEHLLEIENTALLSLDELTKSRFIEMFGDLSLNDKEWPVEQLGEIAEIKIGPFGSLLHKEDYIYGGHALVNPSHIIDSEIKIDDGLTVSESKYDELSAYQLHLGDIVLGRRGEMGRCAVVKTNGLLCGTGSIIVRPNRVMKSFFLQNILSSESCKNILEQMAVGVTMKNLNVPIVSSLEVPILPLPLQEEFELLVEQVDKSKYGMLKRIKSAMIELVHSQKLVFVTF